MNSHVSRRKHHIIYRTVCIVSGRYYLGRHSTDDLYDGYLGSGKRLGRSVRRHGKANHICSILEYLPDSASLKLREAEIVNATVLLDPLCMNLIIGGSGGNEYSTAEETKAKQSKSMQAFWSSAAGIELRAAYRAIKRPQSLATKAKAVESAKARMARMKADGSWNLVVAKNKAAHAGKTLSVEHKAAIGAGGLRYKALHGKKQFSEQAIANISESLKGNSRNKKSWTLLDLNSHQTFQVENISLWAKTNNLHVSTCYVTEKGNVQNRLFLISELKQKLDETRDQRNAAKRARRQKV